MYFLKVLLVVIALILIAIALQLPAAALTLPFNQKNFCHPISYCIPFFFQLRLLYNVFIRGITGGHCSDYHGYCFYSCLLPLIATWNQKEIAFPLFHIVFLFSASFVLLMYLSKVLLVAIALLLMTMASTAAYCRFNATLNQKLAIFSPKFQMFFCYQHDLFIRCIYQVKVSGLKISSERP